MNATNPEPRIVHTVEQPTAVVHERIPMADLSEFFGRAFGTVMAAAQAQGVHLGPYDTLGTTYGAIQERMRAEGLTPSDTMWEYYLSDPETELDPTKWQTRVVWPVT